MMSKDVSVHNAQMSLKVFALHYHESEADATKKNPKKLVFVDPAVAVCRDESMDKPGRVCIKFTEAATGAPFVLGASSVDEAIFWMATVNKSFASHGFAPKGLATDNAARTLTDMSASDPNKAIGLDGESVQMPSGNFIQGEFTGPAQFKRAPDGSLAIVGGGWKLTAEELGQREMQALAGLPQAGHVFTDLQCSTYGIPRGSVLVVTLLKLPVLTGMGRSSAGLCGLKRC